ncbi:MAG: HNH endonuclease [bacterium]|nr:HNH endonuclease [bacterium]
MVKIERRREVPASLAIEKAKGSRKYQGRDVTDALYEDFHDKCYICGIKEQDKIVEHRIPHHENRDLMFDWNNLFLSCEHCNSVKNKGKYESGIIDCCVDDPEERLVFHVSEDDLSVEAIDKNDMQAALTAMLMNEVFTQENSGHRSYHCKRRREGLLMQMSLLYKAIEKYKTDPASKVAERTLAALLNRESAFAEFKRCYYRENYGILVEST